MYGLSEKQFFNTFNRASRMSGVKGTNLLILLESRLDNLVFRMGFAPTRRAARQLVNHGHFLVDGHKVDIPSYTVKPGQVIEVRERSRNLQVINDALDAQIATKDFVSVDKENKKGTYVRHPERKELNPEVNELLVIEYYNR